MIEKRRAAIGGMVSAKKRFKMRIFRLYIYHAFSAASPFFLQAEIKESQGHYGLRALS